ncbi:hypothetical protein VNO77_03185 [Canavalia gladiata]|uniref:Uncharacterized protein n=1 Tax=Canavalia gladiata TaxID=3824 RepID=A0AAN9MV16_CANGL
MQEKHGLSSNLPSFSYANYLSSNPTSRPFTLQNEDVSFLNSLPPMQKHDLIIYARERPNRNCGSEERSQPYVAIFGFECPATVGGSSHHTFICAQGSKDLKAYSPKSDVRNPLKWRSNVLPYTLAMLPSSFIGVDTKRGWCLGAHRPSATAVKHGMVKVGLKGHKENSWLKLEERGFGNVVVGVWDTKCSLHYTTAPTRHLRSRPMPENLSKTLGKVLIRSCSSRVEVRTSSRVVLRYGGLTYLSQT